MYKDNITDKTYTLEVTEKDIKDLAENRAGHRVIVKLRFLLLSFCVIIPLTVIPVEIYDISFAPFLGFYIALLIPLYFWMVVIHKRQTNIIVKEIKKNV